MNVKPMLISLAMIGAMSAPALAAELPAITSAQDQHPSVIAQNPTETSTFRYPIVVNGRPVEGACIMVPLRAVAEPLGFTVTWDHGGVLVDNGVIHTRVTIGLDQYFITTSNDQLVGMSAPFSLGAAPYVQDGVTYVPLGLFNALLGNREDAVSLEENQIVIQTGSTELPNPFVTCGTLTEAEKLAGFSLTLPHRVPGWTEQTTIRALESSLIEVTYEGQGQELVIRKGVGSQDVSGDYQVYETQQVLTAGGHEVTVKGSDGTAALAVWSDSGYTYAVSAAPGMEADALCTLVSGIR